MAGSSNITGDESIIFADNASFDGTERGGKMTTDGELWIGSTASPHVKKGTLSAGTGITITPGSGTIQIATNGAVVPNTITGQTGGALSPTAGNWNLFGNNNAQNGFASFTTGTGSTLTTRSYGTAKWVVNPVVGIGTHQTIQSAINSAVSGETIFITPGTFTEDISLKAGVNLTAFPCDAGGAPAETPNVIILGKCTATFSGSCAISGVQLKTNSDFCLSVTGSSATVITLRSCYIDANNNTAIQFTSSSGSSKISCYDCVGDLDTTGIAYFTMSASGALKFFGGRFNNNGNSSTASTNSSATGGACEFRNMYWNNAVTTSSGAAFIMENTESHQPFILGGTSSNLAANSAFDGASSSAISIGAGATLTINNCVIGSSNTNAITGAGTINYAGLTFNNSSVKINTTTQTGGIAQGGVTQAPSAGFIGEQLRSFIASTSAVSLSSGVGANLTSLSITPGIWDITIIGEFALSAAAVTQYVLLGVSTTSATLPAGTTDGDQRVTCCVIPNNGNSQCVVLPSFRAVVTATTTYYAVGLASFGAGTAAVYGRMSAVRVG